MSSFVFIHRLDEFPLNSNDRDMESRVARALDGTQTTWQPSPSTILITRHDPAWEPSPGKYNQPHDSAITWDGMILDRCSVQSNFTGNSQSYSWALNGNGNAFLFQPESSALVLLTDANGARSLWFSCSSKLFVAASEPRLILLHPETDCKPDINIIAERLAYRCNTPNRTVYTNMEVLAPGHQINISGKSKLSISAWHSFDLHPDPSPRDMLEKQELKEKILNATLQSVKDAIQPLGIAKLGLALSGGLDSSIIAGALHHIGRSGQTTALMQRYPGLECDESEFQEAVLAETDMSRHIVNHRMLDPDRDLLSPTSRSALPLLRTEPENIDMMEWCVTNNIHHRISGIYGDELFGYDGESWLDILVRGELSLAARELGARGIRAFLSETAHHLPSRLRSIRRKYSLSPWLGPAVRKNTDLHRSWELPGRLPGSASLATDRHRFLYRSGWTTINKEYIEFNRVDKRQNFVNPFLNVELAQLLLKVPEHARYVGYDGRGLQRLGHASLLPDKIVNRKDKVNFDARHAADLSHPWIVNCITNLELGKVGLVNARQVKQYHGAVVDSAKNNSPVPPYSGLLWSIIGIECWWREYYH